VNVARLSSYRFRYSQVQVKLALSRWPVTEATCGDR